MGPDLIEVQNISIEGAVELFLMEDQEMIETFSPYAPQEAFTDRIRFRSPVRCS